MTYSRPLLGTHTNKTSISWFEYIWFSCILQGWSNCATAFRDWANLMGNNYQDYALLKDDDPLEQCILYFWDALDDDIYPKEFLEYLMQMVEDVETGVVETIPADEVFRTLEELAQEDPTDPS